MSPRFLAIATALSVLLVWHPARGAEARVVTDRAVAYPLTLPPPGASTPPMRITFAENAEKERTGIITRLTALAQERAANPLAMAVLTRLPENDFFASLDFFFRKRLAESGPPWLESEEGQRAAGLRAALIEACLSARVEGTGPAKEIAYNQRGKRYAIEGFVPEKIESERETRHDVAGMLVRMIVSEEQDDPAVAPIYETVKNLERRNGALSYEADRRGRQAAERGDWPAAIKAFREAQEAVGASPGAWFNLGLAYQRRGWAIPAVMWYRAYLTALPDAPNAATVAAEADKLTAEIQSTALRMLDEAEKLASSLSAAPLAGNAKSPRQASLETMARYASMAGLGARADALMQRAQTLSVARPVDAVPDKHGLYAAYQSLDAGAVRDILRQWDKDYKPAYKLEAQVYVHGMRGEWNEVNRAFAAAPPDLSLDYKLGSFRGYEAMATNDTRRLKAATAFDAAWFGNTLLPDIERALYNGHPAEALALARAAREYAAKYPTELWTVIDHAKLMLLDAVVANRTAVQDRINAWGLTKDNGWYFLGDDREYGMLPARIALALASSLPGQEALPLIDQILRKTQTASTLVIDNWERLYPLSYFVRWTLAGDEAKALRLLDAEIAHAPSDKNRNDYQVYVEYALRFAVATGRHALACDLAERLETPELRLAQLNRLLLATNLAPALRRRVEEQITLVSAGWRPRDAAQAWNVERRLGLARKYSTDDESYASLEEVLAKVEETARTKPETVAQDLAGSAVIWAIAARSARPNL